MNYIGIDASLTSTAISVVNEKGYFFFSYLKGYEKPGKWTKLIEDFVKITGVSYEKDDDYSTQENLKLNDYQNLVSTIISDLKAVLVEGEVYAAIEGYSFSSAAGHLIDLVTLGTLIRDRLKSELNAELNVYSPSTLKKETCGLTYGWTQKGKKKKTYICRNTIGIAGGSFKKHQMLESIKDYNCDSELNKFCTEYFDDIYTLKKIPSPIDDLVDSYWVLKTLINERVHKIFRILNQLND
jgi:hypothetical protein